MKIDKPADEKPNSRSENVRNILKNQISKQYNFMPKDRSQQHRTLREDRKPM